MNIDDLLGEPTNQGPDVAARNAERMRQAINLDGAAGWGEFGNAFKRSWAGGEKLLPSRKVALGEAAVGIGAGAIHSIYSNKDATAPFSLDGAMTMGVGAAAAVGVPMLFRGAKKLKTSIFTGFEARKTFMQASEEAASKLSGAADELAGGFTRSVVE